MEWWGKMIFPLRRVWTGVSSRFRFRNNEENMLPSMSGFLIFSAPANSKHKSESRLRQPSTKFHTRLSMLHQEVKACEYEDVQIMWEMLTRSEAEVARYPPRSNRVWKFFSWARLAPCLARPL